MKTFLSLLSDEVSEVVTYLNATSRANFSTTCAPYRLLVNNLCTSLSFHIPTSYEIYGKYEKLLHPPRIGSTMVLLPADALGLDNDSCGVYVGNQEAKLGVVTGCRVSSSQYYFVQLVTYQDISTKKIDISFKLTQATYEVTMGDMYEVPASMIDQYNLEYLNKWCQDRNKNFITKSKPASVPFNENNELPMKLLLGCLYRRPNVKSLSLASLCYYLQDDAQLFAFCGNLQGNAIPSTLSLPPHRTLHYCFYFFFFFHFILYSSSFSLLHACAVLMT
jgi:hypothetical protein